MSKRIRSLNDLNLKISELELKQKTLEMDLEHKWEYFHDNSGKLLKNSLKPGVDAVKESFMGHVVGSFLKHDKVQGWMDRVFDKLFS
ncbi:MAG: hypothetical protein K2P88_07780 [Chitinophagaceae bacterium]|uniref:hypothetical protein n=1 Tax=unclassified Paraflavitalea TaxID=2798305 RepID=UPI003D3411CB|nr:hypothetical protein [Chitinophagaceae bacterium]